MTDRHKNPPISLRLPEADRAWLIKHAKATGQPVNKILAEAVALYRAGHRVRVINDAKIVSYGPVLDPPWSETR